MKIISYKPILEPILSFQSSVLRFFILEERILTKFIITFSSSMGDGTEKIKQKKINIT